jgi:hypothetical protein
VQSHLDDVALVVVLVNLFARERAAGGGEEVGVVDLRALDVVGRRFEDDARPLDGLAALRRDLRRLGLTRRTGPVRPSCDLSLAAPCAAACAKASAGDESSPARATQSGVAASRAASQVSLVRFSMGLWAPEKCLDVD